jgi:hypothetical protein
VTSSQNEKVPLLFSPCFPCYVEIGPCYFFRGISLETLMESASVDDFVVFWRQFCRFSLYFVPVNTVHPSATVSPRQRRFNRADDADGGDANGLTPRHPRSAREGRPRYWAFAVHQPRSEPARGPCPKSSGALRLKRPTSRGKPISAASCQTVIRCSCNPHLAPRPKRTRQGCRKAFQDCAGAACLIGLLRVGSRGERSAGYFTT